MRSSVERRTLAGIGVAGAAGVLLFVGPTIGDTSLVPPCPFQALTGWDCPFCGGTRAVRALLTGRVGEALDQNLVVVLLALAAVSVLGIWLWRRRSGPPERPLGAWRHVAPRVLPVALVLLAVFAVVRNLPGVPFLHSGIG